MQTMLYGYAGLRLFPDKLTLAPKLPPHTTNVTLTHVRRGTRVGAALPAHGAGPNAKCRPRFAARTQSCPWA